MVLKFFSSYFPPECPAKPLHCCPHEWTCGCKKDQSVPLALELVDAQWCLLFTRWETYRFVKFCHMGPECRACAYRTHITNKQILRCGNRKGLLGRTNQTHNRMEGRVRLNEQCQLCVSSTALSYGTWAVRNHCQREDGVVSSSKVETKPQRPPFCRSSLLTAYIP